MMKKNILGIMNKPERGLRDQGHWSLMASLTPLAWVTPKYPSQVLKGFQKPTRCQAFHLPFYYCSLGFLSSSIKPDSQDIAESWTIFLEAYLKQFHLPILIHISLHNYLIIVHMIDLHINISLKWKYLHFRFVSFGCLYIPTFSNILTIRLNGGGKPREQ
jgi:hypothetical protein